MKKRPSLRELQLECENWNLKHAVGCAVTVELDSGEIRKTRTRSKAEMLSGHTPVIWLEGITGCYILSRVRATAIQSPVKPGAQPDAGAQGQEK